MSGRCYVREMLYPGDVLFERCYVREMFCPRDVMSGR